MLNKGPRRNPRKDMDDIIRKWAKDNIETLSPAVVVSVDKYASERVVSVKPLPLENEEDGDAIEPSVVYDCPVMLTGTLEGYISMPLKLGDTVAVGFCKRPHGEFTKGSGIDPYMPDNYIFGANEAIVIGYWGQGSKDYTVSPDNFEIRYHQGFIRIDPNSAIQLENPWNVQEMDEDGWRVGNSAFTVVFNSDGSASISTNGTLTINGTTFDSGGVVGGITSLTAGAKQLVNHTHAITSGSSSPGPTGPNN